MPNFIAGSKWFPVALLSLLWLGSAAIVYPVSNLPFGDEFAYIKPVEHFLQSGEMRYTDWSSMTLILQVWIGAAFSWLFGFSVSSVRMVGIVSGLSAILALYSCARQIGAERRVAFYIAALLLFNPLFFLMGLSFVTDIPFLGIGLWSVFYFLRFLKEEQLRFFIPAIVLCMAAFFIRDTAIILPPAFALTYLLKHGITKRALVLSLLSVVALACCYAGWRWWLVNVHGLPKNIDFSRNKLLTTFSSPVLLATAVFRNILYTIGYFGTYCLPLAPFAWLILRRWFTTKYWLVFSIISGAVISVALVVQRLNDSLLTHIWDGFTIYIRFDNVYSLSNESIPALPGWVLIASVILALLSGLLITAVLLTYLIRIVRRLRTDRQELTPIVFLTLCLFVYSALIFTQWMIPRYYLVMLPLIALLFFKAYQEADVIPTFETTWLIFFASACLIYVALSFGHDTFARQRAYMEAFHYLESDLKVNSRDIDGGFDYNTWTNYYYEYKSTKDKNWWWVENPRYVVADGHIQNMQLLGIIPYTRWYFPGYTGGVYVHRNTQLP